MTGKNNYTAVLSLIAAMGFPAVILVDISMKQELNVQISPPYSGKKLDLTQCNKQDLQYVHRNGNCISPYPLLSVPG